jgi:hypothetical protein
MPEALREGTCARHPRPSLWLSPRTAAEQEAARHICRACPVLEPCLTWALSLPAAADLDVILGGLTAGERAALRRDPA